MKRFRIGIAAWLGLFGLAGAAHAISIEPRTLFIDEAGSSQVSRRLTIINDSDQPIRAAAEPEYWIQGEAPADINKWLQIEPRAIELSAKGRKTVRVLATVPPRLNGECLVMLFFADPRKTASGGTAPSITIQTRIGIPLYLQRAGTGVQRAELKIFENVVRQDALAGDLVFNLEVENQGNTHLQPLGVVTLEANPAFGWPPISREVHFGLPIFPGRTGQVQVRFEAGAVPVGRYQAKARIFLQTLYPGGGQGNLTVVARERTVEIHSVQR